MSIYIPSHNEDIMPLKLGIVLRCPYFSWSDWNVKWDSKKEFNDLIDMSEEAYRGEWSLGSKERHKVIEEASIRAEIANNNKVLADTAAEYVKVAVDDYNGNIEMLDIGSGSGNSALKMYNALSQKDKERVRITLLEPAAKPLEDAVQRMEEAGANYEQVNKCDLDIANVKEKYDMITGVASLHHHAKIPWEIYLGALKNGGRIVVGDWHNSVWTDKGKVYKMLETMNCSDEGLRNFESAYRVDGMKTPMSQADKDIIKFWNAYREMLEERGQPKQNIIFPLEGHRSLQKYIDEMDAVGFRGIETDVLLPNTGIIAVTTAQKKI